MTRFSLLPLSIVALVSGPTHAYANNCVDSAAHFAGVESALIVAMSYVESGWHLDAENGSNRNGTRDVCAMQINSIHFDDLAMINVTPEDLTTDVCTCLLTGAYVLRNAIAAEGSLWRGVGAYNAGRSTRPAAIAYTQKVQTAYRVIKDWQARRQARQLLEPALPALAP
jgi:hypothetical protein